MKTLKEFLTQTHIKFIEKVYIEIEEKQNELDEAMVKFKSGSWDGDIVLFFEQSKEIKKLEAELDKLYADQQMYYENLYRIDELVEF